MKIILTLMLISSICSNAFAQFDNVPLVSVYGESVVKAKPDYVIIGIKISKDLKLNTTGSINTFEIFKEEDTKIRLFGFDEKNISESLIQIDKGIYVKEVFITINDLSSLDKYLLELYKLGFKDYVYLDYRLKNFVNYKNQAKREAISAAKKEAFSMAFEVGQTIGKANSIKEIDHEDYNWYNIHNASGLENIPYKLGAEGYMIEPGYITITSRVQVSFDLQK